MNINFKSLVLKEFATMADAIENLNRSGKQIAFVCDDNYILLGTITDGDIRKGLAKQQTLEAPLRDLMNHEPHTVSVDEPMEKINALFQSLRLRAFPVVAPDNRLVGVYFSDQLASTLESPSTMLIMAGGFGTRMGDLTKVTPKPMLEVNGKPMLQTIIERAAEENFDRVFISIHYLADKIESYFGNGEGFGVNIEYIREEKPLGTGGSFGRLPDVMGPVLVTNSDVVSNIGYRSILEFHHLNKAGATIATFEHSISNPFGVVESSGIDFVSFEEKPKWVTNINAGIYVVEADAAALVGNDEAISMPTIVERVKDTGRRVIIFPLYENWVDLGNAEQYASYS